jgi:hypothetical protein
MRVEDEGPSAGEIFRQDLADGRASLARDGTPDRMFDLNKPEDRRALDQAIRAAMHSGLSYSKATAAIAHRATYGAKPQELNVNDPVTRSRLHGEAMRRVAQSKADAAGSAGKIKAVGFGDALGSIFSDIAKGAKVEGLS